MAPTEILTLVKRIKAIADTGLVYAREDYDEERYEELRQIAVRLLGHLADKPFSELDGFFMPAKDYPTPKVDVRALVLNEKGEILMGRERVDGKWTVPGGWADIGDTPKNAIIREIQEETGLEAEVVRLLAVYDKQRHPHPPEPFYVYKLMFYCRVKGGVLRPGFDMLEVGWFPLEALPELSRVRILEAQLKHLVGMVDSNSTDVYVD